MSTRAAFLLRADLLHSIPPGGAAGQRAAGSDPTQGGTMSDRYTRKDVERAFDRLCDLLGKRQAASYNDKGAWELDYNPVYGGYVVYELLESGGVHEPFGSQRVSAREFCGRVNFLSRGLETILDTSSSASRQHFIETGRYLFPGEALES